MAGLRVDESGGILRLTIDRADAMNALDNALLDALLHALRAAESKPAVRAIILSAEGEKAFSSGIDLVERSRLDTAGKAAQSERVLDIVRALHESAKPTFAAIGGWCLGAGLEVALAVDVRVAAEDARFGFPEMTLGAYPGGGGAVLLPRLIGRQRALAWLYSARRLSAAEAKELSLVTDVVPRAELDRTVNERAAEAAARAPLAIAALKRSINGGSGLPFAEALAFDQRERRPLDATDDYQEGLRAFREKRPPQFKGT